MTREPTYCVLLLPTCEIARPHCTLREAAAWLATYNEIMDDAGGTAAIVEERRGDFVCLSAPEPASGVQRLVR